MFLRNVFEAEALRAWDADGLCPAPDAAHAEAVAVTESDAASVTPADAATVSPAAAPAEGDDADENKPERASASGSRLSGKQPCAVSASICRPVSTLELTSLKRITKKL